MSQQAVQLLKHNQLRLTNCRKDVIAVFLQKDQAVGQPELEKLLPNYDRVTIYRTLHTFEEKGLVHKIFDGTGSTKYAICSTHCTEHRHHDEHVHFQCEQCGTTKCIENISVPPFHLPKGYQIHHANFLLCGICKECSV